MKKSHRQSMPIEGGSSHPALLLLVATVVAIATAPGIVKADVLYDTSDMITNQTYDTSCSTFIGGFATYGEFRDEQAADDFELAANYRITKVTGYYLTSDPTSPDGGVLVEFFGDVNGRPSEVPASATLSANYTLKTFEDTVFGAYAFSLSVDLSDLDISLDTGVWWVSITPVDETLLGLRYNQWRQLDLLNGSIVHGRGGGQDHGTGYAGHFYGGDDWLRFGDETGCCDPGDLAMKIEGTPVKPACPWDLDVNGSIGASDLLSLLAAWGPCKDCDADFDGNGSVGASDLLALLANWGPCP